MRPLSLFALFFLLWLPCFAQQNSSWNEIQNSGKGAVTVFWFPNDPYGYKNADGQMTGIEVEILQGFQKYLETHHHINLTIRWEKEPMFKDVLDQIKVTTEPGVFGMAGFSFSEERRTFMKFSPSYMADIAVFISTPDIPIIRSNDDMRKYLEGSTAITAQGTVLEKELIQLRDLNKLPFKIEYTTSHELIKVIEDRKKSFGYLSLPVYLMALDNRTTKLNRQNYLTKRYEGRGIGLPITSDWDVPLKEYFESADFKQRIEPIISGYVNMELYRFIETFNPENEVSLLNKEKDIQQMQLKVQELTIRDKNQEQTYLVIIISAVTLLLIVIGILFRRQIHTHRILKEQKAEIEAQSDEILTINNNLEMLIRARTQELVAKNKALEEYAFITAHKLRVPLASILGLVALLDRIDLCEEDKIILRHLSQSANQLDGVIHSVMMPYRIRVRSIDDCRLMIFDFGPIHSSERIFPLLGIFDTLSYYCSNPCDHQKVRRHIAYVLVAL